MAADGWTSPVVGVLGGMGPAATVAFLDQLVRLTDAHTDQGHIDTIVTQHGSIPPRSDFILQPEAAADPTPALVADARRLHSAGADMLVIPCNTACHYLPAIAAAVPIPCVSIVDVTARRAVTTGHVIAVLATEGTIAAGLFQQAIQAAGGQSRVPPPRAQHDINDVIEQVKAGRPADLGKLNACIVESLTAGADAVIFGCTELSVVYDRSGYEARAQVIDSLRSLVLHTITACGRGVRA